MARPLLVCASVLSLFLVSSCAASSGGAMSDPYYTSEASGHSNGPSILLWKYNSDKSVYLVVPDTDGTKIELSEGRSLEGWKEVGNGTHLEMLLAQYHRNPKYDKDSRNRIINLALDVIDAHFNEFMAQFPRESKAWNSGADIASITLDVVSSLVTPPSTKSITAAVSGAITASKVSIDKNYFYDKSLSALLSTMRSQRKEFRSVILRGMKAGTDEYPLAAAHQDVYDYFFAGTIDGAVANVIKEAGAQQVRAEEATREPLRAKAERVLARRKRVAELTYNLPRARIVDAIQRVVANLDASSREQTLRAIRQAAYDQIFELAPVDEDGDEEKAVIAALRDSGIVQINIDRENFSIKLVRERFDIDLWLGLQDGDLVPSKPVLENFLASTGSPGDEIHMETFRSLVMEYIQGK